VEACAPLPLAELIQKISTEEEEEEEERGLIKAIKM
jgi:hypothetical protein